ncbi:unannotated protein [freshwater metagenome]|uniref:Unannotated protein n=1 Tax=freshwater metagenome TaxID=449393 RepID=A0A6J6CMT2_9ZZZZ
MTVESVLFFPVVLMIVLSGFHFAALMHAHHVGSVAASRGASLMARSMASHGNVTRAVDEINRVTKEMGGVPFGGPKITESPTHFEVTVSLSSPQIVPFLPASVHRTATSAKEFFIEAQDR